MAGVLIDFPGLIVCKSLLPFDTFLSDGRVLYPAASLLNIIKDTINYDYIL